MPNCKKCKKCGKRFKGASKECRKCRRKTKRERRIIQLFDIMGRRCWLCGKSWGEFSDVFLHFHHTKLKRFSIKKYVGKKGWDELIEEVRKCGLLCPNCHMAYHIKNDPFHLGPKIEKVYKKKWGKILENEEKLFLLQNPPKADGVEHEFVKKVKKKKKKKL